MLKKALDLDSSVSDLASIPSPHVLTLFFLAVSAAIVRKHGGHIGVRSSGIPGTGSIFYIDLPITYDPETKLLDDIRLFSSTHDSKKVIPQNLIPPALNRPLSLPLLPSSTSSPSTETRPTSSSTTVPPLSTSRPHSFSLPPPTTDPLPPLTHELHFECALVVDDSVLTRKMLVKSIGSYFTTILQGGDGREAVQIMKSQLALGAVPNVVFLDSIMPNMSGIDACREMRALGYNGIILAVTGNVLPSDIEEFLAAGADKLIPKPIKIGDIKSTLEGTAFRSSCH
jgi:CheY-like chemotaxis protein